MVLPQRTQSPQASRMAGGGGRVALREGGGAGSRSGMARRVSCRKWSSCSPPHLTQLFLPLPTPAPLRLCWRWRRTAHLAGSAARPCLLASTQRRGPITAEGAAPCPTRRGCRESRKPDSPGSAPTPALASPLAPWERARPRRWSFSFIDAGSEAQLGGVGDSPARTGDRDPWGLEMNGGRRGQEPGCQARHLACPQAAGRSHRRFDQQATHAGDEPERSLCGPALLPYTGTSLSRRRRGPRG